MVKKIKAWPVIISKDLRKPDITVSFADHIIALVKHLPVKKVPK
jgi:hypothetical protein